MKGIFIDSHNQKGKDRSFLWNDLEPDSTPAGLFFCVGLTFSY